MIKPSTDIVTEATSNPIHIISTDGMNTAIGKKDQPLRIPNMSDTKPKTGTVTDNAREMS